MSFAMEPLPPVSAETFYDGAKTPTLMAQMTSPRQMIRRRFIEKPLDFIGVTERGGSMTKLTTNVQSPLGVGECVRR